MFPFSPVFPFSVVLQVFFPINSVFITISKLSLKFCTTVSFPIILLSFLYGSVVYPLLRFCTRCSSVGLSILKYDQVQYSVLKYGTHFSSVRFSAVSWTDDAAAGNRAMRTKYTCLQMPRFTQYLSQRRFALCPLLLGSPFIWIDNVLCITTFYKHRIQIKINCKWLQLNLARFFLLTQNDLLHKNNE